MRLKVILVCMLWGSLVGFVGSLLGVPLFCFCECGVGGPF